MDRKSIVGIVLMVGLVIIWSVWVASNQSEEQALRQQAVADSTRRADSLAALNPRPDSATATAAVAGFDSTRPAPTNTAQVAAAPNDDTTRSLPDSARLATERADRFGAFAPAATGTNDTVTVTTDRAVFRIASRGGKLVSVSSREYTTWDGKSLPFWQPDTANQFQYTFSSRGRVINTGELYFAPTAGRTFTVAGTNRQTIALRADLGNGKYLEQRYTFTGNAYDLQYRFVLAGVGQDINDASLALGVQLRMPQTEAAWSNQYQKTTLLYQLYDDDPSDGEVSYLTEMSTERETEESSASVKWVAFKSHFFSTIFIADNRFQRAVVTSQPFNEEMLPPTDSAIKLLQANVMAPYSRGAVDSIALRMYFGPNDVTVLDDYNLRLGKIVDMGWGPLRYISYGIMGIFHLLEGAIPNYGIIILILSIVLLLVLLPLTYRSIVSQVKMGIVNKLPEIQQINEKFKAEPQTLQRERMKFYGQVGVNPMSGCLPLLLQMPILIAMFMFFPNSIDLRQQPFLWATDLSTYDPFIDFGGRIPLIGTHLSLFCLLWVAAQLISAYITQRQQGVQPGQPKFMQYFPYIMPLLFFGIFNDYSSGLTWYYLCYTVLSLVQRQLVKMFLVDENKLRQQIHDYKEGKVARKRGGGLMGWMQRMQANREEMVQERNAQMQGRQGRRALENQRAKQQQRGGNPQPRKRK